ncbi:MAG: hypothetical protein R2854_15635 [Caldilineaceae bacterium]
MARAAEFIPQRQAQLQADLAQLDQLRVDLTLAENQPEIAAVQDELRALGLTPRSRTRKPQGNSGQPMRFHHESGLEIVVGRNARQNEIVTFKIASRRSLAARAQCPRRPRGHPPGRADAQPSVHRGRGTVGGVLLQGAG